MSGLLALSQVDERYAQTALDRSEADALIKEWGTKGKSADERVTIARARRENAAEVIEKRDALNGAYARRKLLEVMYSNIERDYQAVSRELTRRTEREPYDKKADRIRA